MTTRPSTTSDSALPVEVGFIKLDNGFYDVTDFPEPGSWTGRVEKKPRWPGGASRWFAYRADQGSLAPLDRDGYRSRAEAVAALVASWQERADG